MKLVDVFLIGLTILFLIIGLDQSIVLGFEKGYWAFMLALVTFFVFNYRKSKRRVPDEPEPGEKSVKKSRKP
jgi:hypothetical protein